MMTKKERVTPLFLFLSALLWSLSGVFTKSAVRNGLCLATLCYFVQGALFTCANKYTAAANATVLSVAGCVLVIGTLLIYNAAAIRRGEERERK